MLTSQGILPNPSRWNNIASLLQPEGVIMSENKSFLSGNPILWAWLPLGFLASQIAFEMTLPQNVLQAMNNENGLIELLQALIVFIGFLVALVTLIKGWKTMRTPLKLWITLAALCCLYVTGEEISWGQHFFNWMTPENWQAVNDQQETNLHNTSSWLDQKPRIILLLGVICGGLIIPALQKFKPEWLPQRFKVIYPESALWLLAAITLAHKIGDKIAESANTLLFERISELEETYMFYFVLLYLLTMYHRLVPSKSGNTL
jgi:glucan phosphoethanolaminetransferase (alkaline phosphatase superfamily)